MLQDREQPREYLDAAYRLAMSRSQALADRYHAVGVPMSYNALDKNRYRLARRNGRH